MNVPLSALKEIVVEVARALPHRLTRQPDCDGLAEDALWRELAASILGSAVSYGTAFRALEGLQVAGLLDPGVVPRESSVERSLRLSGYRFPRVRAQHLSRSAAAIYGSGFTIGELLGHCGHDGVLARQMFVHLCPGLGPKQASLFLRNVGFANQAILDRHVLAYLQSCGVIPRAIGSIQSLRQYEAIEGIVSRQAASSSLSVAAFDLAVWVTMRSLPRPGSA